MNRSALGLLRWLSWVACVHPIGAAVLISQATTVVGDVVEVRVLGLSLGSFAGRTLEGKLASHLLLHLHRQFCQYLLRNVIGLYLSHDC